MLVRIQGHQMGERRCHDTREEGSEEGAQELRG